MLSQASPADLQPSREVNWRWSPTANLTNEAIFGLRKFFFTFATPFPDPNLPFAFINVATENTNFSYNARGVRTLQYIDNATLIHGSHTLKGGLNFRFNRHRDDRSNVAGSAIEPVVGFSGVSGFGPFNLPASGSTSINANDLTRLQHDRRRTRKDRNSLTRVCARSK